jgi:hypothetical protein
MPIQLSGSLVITGSITTTGVITMSGSIASASYSSTSDLLQGTGSVGFATTASLLNVIAIGATTGSNSFRATQSITGSLTVTGQIIAQTINVQQVTSSIIYSSGSNIFGCDLNSRQTFTGSFYQTGSAAYFSGCVGVGSNSINGYRLEVTNPSCTTGYANVFFGLHTGNNTFTVKQFGASHAAAASVNQIGVVNAEQHIHLVTDIQACIDAGTSTKGIFLRCGGLVGIGTQSPSSLLHIQKSSNSGDAGVFPMITVNNCLATQGDGSTSYNFAAIYTNSGNGAVQMSMQSSYAAGTWEPQGILNVGTNHPMVLKTNNTERMRITCGGNVGIGTQSPDRLLTINGDSTLLGNNYISTNKFLQWEGGAYWTTRVTSTGNQFEIYRGDTGASPFVISSCNKIGIGATSPRWLLEICANNTCGGAGHYPAISINNANCNGYSAYYFYKGADQMGGLEMSNGTGHLLINSPTTFAIQTSGNNRLLVSGGSVCVGVDSYFCGSTYGIMGFGCKVFDKICYIMTTSGTICVPLDGLTYGSGPTRAIYLYGTLLGNDSLQYAHMVYFYRNDYGGLQAATVAQASCAHPSTAGQTYAYTVNDPGGLGKSACTVLLRLTSSGAGVAPGSYCTQMRIVVYNVPGA